MINFQNTYDTLPSQFFEKADAAEVSNPKLLAFNKELARDVLEIDLEGFSEAELAGLFSGQLMPESASSIAMAYAGHQFGHFNPQLGDGRALLMGEVLNSKNQRFDVQLKGSGQTPFSRRGDGKSSLGPVIREYIVSEAMFALGVPTTRSLAAVSTGDNVVREELLPGGVFTRVAASHIRVGTFEFFAARRDLESLRALLDYTIERHYPEIKKSDSPSYYQDFIRAVANKQSALVSKWMSLGFIHGVMNTDNMSVSGETIDFGPCAFMDNFKLDRKFSSIDRDGRYAYNNQIPIAKWNLSALASTLVLLIDKDEETATKLIQDCFVGLDELYQKAYLDEMVKKFGIFSPTETDNEIIQLFFAYLEKEDLDFTLSFRELTDDLDSFKKSPEFFSLLEARLNSQTESRDESIALMNSVNPRFIPRNHQVERAINEAYKGNLETFNKLNECLKNPFTEQSEFSEFALAPKRGEWMEVTFCGT